MQCSAVLCKVKCRVQCDSVIYILSLIKAIYSVLWTTLHSAVYSIIVAYALFIIYLQGKYDSEEEEKFMFNILFYK